MGSLRLLIALAGVLLAPVAAMALEVPPKPSVPVVDQTNTLTQSQIDSLVTQINAERTASGNQIAILMIPSLEDEALEAYSLEVARGWGVGEKDKNNGVLLLIAKEDRKLRIEVGYGNEGDLTDARSSQIIRDRITPEFRNGRYYEGIDSGLKGIITAIHREGDPALSQEGDDGFSYDWLGALFILPLWLSSILARTKSWWAGGVVGAIIAALLGFFFGMIIGIVMLVVLVPLGLFFDWAVSRNFHARKRDGLSPSWWAGGTTLGGGNSGGGGFGGGSFGGGGSSGSW